MSAGGEIAIKIVGHADTRDIEAVRKAIAGLGPDFAKTARDISVEGDKASRSLRDVGNSAQDAARKAESGSGGFGILTKGIAATTAAAGVLAVGLGVFGAKAVLSASDVAEAQSKVNVVFGDSAAVINDMAANAATALGQTKGEVLSAAGSFGNLLTAMGMSKDGAADLSVEAIQLATDLGSFNNAAPTDVLAAMTAAMAGETDGMKKYGVVINETTLKQAAMAAGLGDNVQKLSATEKQMLSMKIMMEQTTAAQGDFDRTSSGLANTMKIIKASAADVVAEIGARLLPTVEAAASAFASGFQAAKDDGMDPFTGALVGLSASLEAVGFPGVADKVADFAAALSQATDVIFGHQDAVTSTDPEVQAWGDTIVAVASFVRDDLMPAVKDITTAVIAFGKFLVEHKGIVLTIIAVYATFKTALAINKAVEGVSLALTGTTAPLKAYKAGTLAASFATTSFSTALKLAAGPVGWIVLALGALTLAYQTNFGGIRDKVQAFLNWWEMIPQYFTGVFDEVVQGVKDLLVQWAVLWAKVKADPIKGFGELVVFLYTLPFKFLGIGLDIVQGLWDGMKKAWAGLKRWLTGQASDIPRTVKAALPMASPPPKMVEIGWWIVEAMRLGMVKAESGLIDTASNIARDAVAAFWAFENGGSIEAGRAAVAALIAQVQGLRAAFLTGGAAEEGSLAWLLSTAADGLPALDFGALFASMNIPVADIDAFGRLLAQLVDAGELDRAQDLWSRFYDEIGAREDAIHEQRMANIERDRAGALKLIDDVAKAQKAAGDAEAVRVARVIQNQRDSEQKTGAPASEIKDFDNLWRQSAENMRALLETLNGGPIKDIEKAFRDFWVEFNGGAVSGITNSQQLTEAIAALIDAVGKSHEDAAAAAEEAWDATAKTEEQRHNRAVELLKARASLIDTLLADQALAEEALNALYAERERLLRLAQESIRAAQKAAEEFEDSVHAGVMRNIAELRRVANFDHKTRMIQLGDEKKAIESGHVARLAQLQAQRDKVTKGFDERRTQIEKERTALGQLKLDLGVEDALIRLTGLQDKLNDLKGIMDSFKIVSRGREALDEQRRAVIERVKITTDAQRKALQDVLDSGTLSAKDARRVELLLLGRGTQRATDVQRILGASADVLQGQIDAAQMIVDRNTLMVTAAERRIELAETQLSLDEQNAGVILQAIDDRIAREADRYAREMGAIDAKIAAEEDAFNQAMDWLDQLDQAEDDRHAKRMSDIAAEYALELAKLGMSQEQIDAMVAGAQREAARIAAETEAAFKRLREAAGLPGTVGSTGPAPLPPSIPHVSIGTLPGMLGPMPPGNPIIGLRPGGTPGGLEVNITQPAVTINPVPVTYNDTFVTNTTLVVGGKTLTEFNQQLDAQRQRDMAIGGGP